MRANENRTNDLPQKKKRLKNRSSISGKMFHSGEVYPEEVMANLSV
jgi:hypothetical protein